MFWALVFVVVAGAYLATDIGLWKVFIELFQDSRRRGWFKWRAGCESMRIIAGSLKVRRLKAPTWDGLRPTADKLRETLFNILAARIVGARLVDAFAGTGAAGLEAISRGARDVAFIERDRRAQDLIEENLAHCGVTTGYTIVRSDVLRGLEWLRARGVYDIILLDPPYGQDPGEIERILATAGTLLAADGLLVFEHARRTVAPAAADGVKHARDVDSGNSTLSFYERGRD